MSPTEYPRVIYANISPIADYEPSQHLNQI